jgi:hypothetical protein
VQPQTFNLDFGASPPSKQVGPAAAGSAGDYWNGVAVAFDDHHTESDLKFAGGDPSPIEVEMINLGGCWTSGGAMGVKSAMFDTFNYPTGNRGGNSTVILHYVPAGKYHVYIYGHNPNPIYYGDYTLTVGTREYGRKQTSHKLDAVQNTKWVEGSQYVKFSNVKVGEGEEFEVLIQPGGQVTDASGRTLADAMICGLQLIPVNRPGAATTGHPAPAGRPVAIPSPPGLVSWWSAEGNAKDRMGAHDGTLRGGATFAPGKVGQAFSFDPASGTMIVPDSSSLRLTDQLTIAAWIKTRSINSDQAIVSKVGGAAGNNGYQLVLSGNTLMGQFNSPGENWPSARVTSEGLIAPEVWYHVAWTYDQSAMKLYLNGFAVATSVVGPQPIVASRSNLRISGDDNNHVYFDGLIDEASVYNRALSAREIQTIYKAGGAGKRLPR